MSKVAFDLGPSSNFPIFKFSNTINHNKPGSSTFAQYVSNPQNQSRFKRNAEPIELKTNLKARAFLFICHSCDELNIVNI